MTVRTINQSIHQSVCPSIYLFINLAMNSNCPIQSHIQWQVCPYSIRAYHTIKMNTIHNIRWNYFVKALFWSNALAQLWGVSQEPCHKNKSVFERTRKYVIDWMTKMNVKRTITSKILDWFRIIVPQFCARLMGNDPQLIIVNFWAHPFTYVPKYMTLPSENASVIDIWSLSFNSVYIIPSYILVCSYP